MRNKPRTKIADPSSADWGKVAETIKPLIPKDEVHHAQVEGGNRTDHKSILDIRTKPVTIGIPLDEIVFSKFFVNFELLDKMPWDNMITTTSTYLPDARNKVHNFFLNDDKAEHLFMLDSDVLPPPKIIATLLAHKKDMVGGYYVKKEKYPVKNAAGEIEIVQRPVVYDHYGHQEGVIQYVQRRFPGEGLEEVAAAGAGCWLMSRKLAEALGESPYNMGDGTGEDLDLCKKITVAGFPMFVDWNMRCAHVGTWFV